MKDILKIIIFSFLGGVLSLLGYTLLKEKDQVKNDSISSLPTSFTIPISNSSNKKSVLAENIDFTSAAEKTIHSVVHVTNTVTYKQPRSIFEYYNNQGEQIEKGSTGSGVIISEDGYIVTNNHVIENADKLTVTLNNRKSYVAQVIGFDKKNDIALLKIATDIKLPYIPFGNSNNIKIGEWVLAVGNPYNLNSTVTAGIISAKSRDLDGDTNIQSFLQTDAVVNPGNSGGALVNTRGELIGINTAISSRTGSYIGYSFAVPSNITKKIIEDLLEFGNVQQAVLGVSGYELNNNTASRNDIDETEGYFITNIEPNSGAEKGGLKNGDIIKSIDQNKISKFSDLTGYLSTKRPNDTISINILRNGESKNILVKLSNKTVFTIKAFDLELKNLSSEEIKYQQKNIGVKVVGINNKSLSKELGISKGCIITKINEKRIESIDDLRNFSNTNFKTLYNIEVKYQNGEIKNWWIR
jgi:Do/DeqQ family serine protease